MIPSAAQKSRLPMARKTVVLLLFLAVRSITAFSSITPRGGEGRLNSPSVFTEKLSGMISAMSDMPKSAERPEIDIQEILGNAQEMIENATADLTEIIDYAEEIMEKAADDIAEMMERSLEAFPLPAFLRRPGGGRAPSSPDKVYSEDIFVETPATPTEARLIVVQITDVYTLEYFAHLKTMLEEIKDLSDGCKVVCVLTGDFLSPYLLSSVDRGYGMMHALANTPIDYLSWGNHEADIDHKAVCRHVRNFPGKWLNSNMLDHDAFDCQQEYDVIQLDSPDGSNSRKVGLCAVLSDDPALYSHFEALGGAFGGATITDPWVALKKYKTILEQEEGCDMALPLQHLYVPDDHKTCKEFDFPVILSGHDHHRVDEVVEGTRLIKPGMNGIFATVLELSWHDASTEKPTIRSRFVKTDDWKADPMLAEECERAYDALLPLRNTELAQVPSNFKPLSSVDSRGSVCTMGRFICTLLRTSLKMSRKQRRHSVDAVLLMGGNIRGNADYELGCFFSLQALEAEIKSDEVIGVVSMPGWLLAKGVEETHSGDPIPGWMQYDEGVREDYSGDSPVVTHVAGIPIDPDRVYRVATKISDLTNGQSPSWTEYYLSHPNFLPPVGSYVNIHAELMGYFARKLWRDLWNAISQSLRTEECSLEGSCGPEERLEMLDQTGNGVVTVEDIQVALRDMLGINVDNNEMALAKFVHSYADTTGDGRVTKNDFKIFCEEMIEENGILPVDIPQLELDPKEAEAILNDARAEREERSTEQPVSLAAER